MVRRAQHKDDSTRPFRPVRIAATPDSSLAAIAGRGEAAAPILRGLSDPHAIAAERAARVLKVFNRKGQTALLVST